MTFPDTRGSRDDRPNPDRHPDRPVEPALSLSKGVERLSCLSSVLPWFLVPERSEGDGGAVPNNGPARRFARSISRLSVGGRISAGSTPAIPSPTPPAPAGRCSVIVASPSAAARPRRSVHPRPPAARYGGEAPGPGRRGYREGTRDRSLPPVQSFETGVSRRAFRDGASRLLNVLLRMKGYVWRFNFFSFILRRG